MCVFGKKKFFMNIKGNDNVLILNDPRLLKLSYPSFYIHFFLLGSIRILGLR